MRVQVSTAREIMSAPNFQALIAEYAVESAIEGMPSPKVRMKRYCDIETTGLLHSLSATSDEGDLVGFITILFASLPHYSKMVATAESFFVAKAHRSSLAGLKLLAAAEKLAAKLGSPGLLVIAPYGGKLFELLPKLGYAETNRVFFKSCPQ